MSTTNTHKPWANGKKFKDESQVDDWNRSLGIPDYLPDYRIMLDDGEIYITRFHDTDRRAVWRAHPEQALEMAALLDRHFYDVIQPLDLHGYMFNYHEPAEDFFAILRAPERVREVAVKILEDSGPIEEGTDNSQRFQRALALAQLAVEDNGDA